MNSKTKSLKDFKKQLIYRMKHSALNLKKMNQETIIHSEVRPEKKIKTEAVLL